MKLLQIYANVSGQEINLTKSEVFFSCNISIPTQKDIAKIMRVCSMLGTSTYLGLPLMIGSSKKGDVCFY